MEGLPTHTKERGEDKEIALREKVEEFKKRADLLGRGMDSNMLKCIAVLNLMEVHTTGSCGGHIEENGEERISFPYIYFAAPDRPVNRFVREEEFKEMLAKKYHTNPSEVLGAGEEIEHEFYNAVKEGGYGETEEWKQWLLENQELKKKFDELFDEFKKKRGSAGDIHLRFARIFPGFRIETIDQASERELKRDKDKRELAKEKVGEAQKEMEVFTKFLEEKYLAGE